MKTLDDFVQKLLSSLKNGTFVQITIGHAADKKDDLRTVFGKRVLIKKGERLSLTYRFTTKDVVKNLEFSELPALLGELLGTRFLRSELRTTEETVLAIFSKKGEIKVKTSSPSVTEAPDPSHDTQKARYVVTENNEYLRGLGILNARFEVVPGMRDKLRQIQKFLEIVDGLLKQADLPDEFSVADMGSGKGYLTFALYDYVTNRLKRPVTVTGIEFRKELVDSCNSVAEKSNFERLSFRSGTIGDTNLGHIDALVALHACDTATDDAIFRGISANASIIICSPCCHKQVRGQMKVSHEFGDVLRNGILEERQAEIVTDGIRALIMEAYGYKTKVFEFISSEHTGKNLMITGVKSNDRVDREAIFERIRSIKRLFGIRDHYLERLFGLPI